MTVLFFLSFFLCSLLGLNIIQIKLEREISKALTSAQKLTLETAAMLVLLTAGLIASSPSSEPAEIQRK